MLVAAKVAAVEVATATGLVAATQIQFLNTVLNVFGVLAFLLTLFLAPRAFKANTMKAELEEKDRIIKGRSQLAEVAEAEKVAATAKAAELGAALDLQRTEAAAWEARYDEQAKYTAGPALIAIQELLERQSAQQASAAERQEKEAARRHKEMLLSLRALRHLGSRSLPSDDEDDDASILGAGLSG